MSFFGLLHTRKIRTVLLIALFIFLLNFCSGFQASLNPYQTEINANIGTEVCKDFYLASSSNVNFDLESLWSDSKVQSKNLGEYDLAPSQLGILVSNEVYSNSNLNSSRINVCFTGEKAGTHYGVLLFSLNNLSLGLGSWITLNILGDEENNNNLDRVFNLITGNAVSSGFNSESIVIIAGTLPAVLLLVLLILLMRKKNKINSKRSKIILNVSPKK